MTHRQVLLSELDQHGRVTYQELVERYGSRGYTLEGFRVAVMRAMQRGELCGPGMGRRQGYITRACPMCKRPL